MESIRVRPHVQGNGQQVFVEETAEKLTDGPGLLALRAVWDALGLGAAIDEMGKGIGGVYRPSLMVEQWLGLLWYGLGCMDHLEVLAASGIPELFGWKSVADPTTYGRWLRRAGGTMAEKLESLLREVVALRWSQRGAPKEVMLLYDSTVVLRYGEDQAGAEVGYNPRKRGRPSHHPLLGFLDTGDCVGVRWRGGKANTAEGVGEELEKTVQWLREAGVERIVVRLDKGFFSREQVQKLKTLGVGFVMKMQESKTMQRFKGAFRPCASDPRLEVSEGEWEGVRVLCVREMAAPEAAETELPLGKVVLKDQATILTNLEDLDEIGAWRLYNQGAVVEHRIEEMGQLGVGKTAVDHLGGNRLLWAMGALAYELLHFVRTTALPESWARAQAKSLRNWLVRMPGKVVHHARRVRVKLMEADPRARLLRGALARLDRIRSPQLLMAR